VEIVDAAAPDRMRAHFVVQHSEGFDEIEELLDDDFFIGLGTATDGIPRETGWDITAASELMAILGLASDLKDLRARLGRTVIGYDRHRRPITAEDLKGAGAMAALIGLDQEQVEAICREASSGDVVSPANYNAPGQIVIAGHAAAVDRAKEAARAAGARKIVSLAVSAPFHCSLMTPVAERLGPVLDEMEFRSPAMPVYANVDGGPVTKGAAARSLLIRQVVSPVRWVRLIENMIADGFDTFLELGPGRVLAGLVKRIDRNVRVLSSGDPDSLAGALETLKEVKA
jgi:malonyl CoA-acyl carrier protein transacylase